MPCESGSNPLYSVKHRQFLQFAQPYLQVLMFTRENIRSEVKHLCDLVEVLFLFPKHVFRDLKSHDFKYFFHV